MVKRENLSKKISLLLKDTFRLIKQTKPQPDEFDVFWNGPYFISGPKKWYPTRFLLHKNHLYCSVTVDWHTYSMTWKVGTRSVEFETSWSSGGDYYNNEWLWSKVLAQVSEKLKWAIQNPAHYNKHVGKRLPLACRTGKIKRHLTWEKGVKSVIQMSKINRLEQILAKSKALPGLKKMTLNQYLGVVAIAKDAAFKDVRNLPLIEKYKRHGDMRHGGLLDLSMDDSSEFAKWYHSGRWAGSHPWEIVFGNPHGIMLAPYYEESGWSYRLWVDSLGWYKEAALMAIALGKKDVPFEFIRSDEFIQTIKGEDTVEAGPFFGMVSFEELKEYRPDAIKRIQWDPIHEIVVIDQRRKV